MKRHRRAAVAASVCTALALPGAGAAAQGAGADSTNHEPNGWVVYSGSHAWSSRFGLYLEGQMRRADGVNVPKQLLVRPGLRYRWTDRVAVTAGYAYQRTSPHGILAEPVAVPEHRAWEQVEVETPAGRLGVAHRVRLEHRWEQEVEASPGLAPRRAGWASSTRARYQIRATRPLHGGAPDAPGWYLTATAEPFARVAGGGGGRAFDQSRAFVGVGRRWGEALRVEGGYLNQHDVPERGPARETSHVLQLAVYSDAPLTRRGR